MLLFFEWLFVESTAHAARAWFFFLKFAFDLFSVPLLVRTYFSPWHRYWYGYSKTFDPTAWFWALFGNAMSRVIGVILRTLFIFLGLLCAVFFFVIGLVCIAFWIALPFASVYLFYLGWQFAF